jgi:SNF2-related domain
VLRAQHGPSTLLTLSWEWEYSINRTPRRAPLGIDHDTTGLRDHTAERELIMAMKLDEPALTDAGLLDQAGRPVPGPPAPVVGLESLHIATAVIPRLAEHPDICVDTDGAPPDYRDVSESLAIGVSTAEIVGQQDWFDLGVTISVDDREVPSPRISRYQAGLWSDLTALGVATEQADRWQRAMAPLLELDSLPSHEEPKALRGQLRPYQVEGFSWLAALWGLELGGILADDMGLGKTIQALTLICHARERDSAIEPFLVVAPTSVAPNWALEAARFTPDLDVNAVVDTLAKSKRSMKEIARADVVVTTYTLFRLDAETYRTVPWAGLVLDEAQFVKNHRGKTYGCVRDLDTAFKLATTGTPMEKSHRAVGAAGTHRTRPLPRPATVRRAMTTH